MPIELHIVGELLREAFVWLMPGFVFDHIWVGGWNDALRWMSEASL